MTAFGGSCRTATMPLMTAVRTEQTFAGLAPTGAYGPYRPLMSASNTAAQHVIAAIRAECSIESAQSFVCGLFGR